MHWIYPQPATAPDSKQRCWTCNAIRTDSEIRACTRPHCTAHAAMMRADEKAGGTREPKPNPGEIMRKDYDSGYIVYSGGVHDVDAAN